jgi:peroxiredoxin
MTQRSTKTGWIAGLLAVTLFLACSPHKPRRDFTLKDLDGKPWSLSAHLDRPVLLTFGATWCDKCRDELQVLGRITRDKPVWVAVISRDPQNATDLRRQMTEVGLNAPILPDESIKVFTLFDVKNLPNTILLNRQGEEIMRATGGFPEERAQLEVEINRLLKIKKKKIEASPAGGQ